MAGTKRIVQALEVGWREDAIINSRYRLNDLIGRGGFGEVWRAQLVKQPSQTVAIKRLLHSRASETARRRFQREQRALKLLYRHENVVTIYDSGEYYGQDYIVLEHVDGQTLRAWLGEYRQPGRPLPTLRVVLQLVGQICSALQAAYRLKIVHRDLKPENIMLRKLASEQWCVKILDFGVARIGSQLDTQSGDRLGTCGYMSPEQATGGVRDVGPPSDVFAIGVLCLEMLTLSADSPHGDPYASFVVQHWDELQSRLRDLRYDVPIELWKAICRALHPRIKERYPNAEALWLAIKNTLGPLAQDL